MLYIIIEKNAGYKFIINVVIVSFTPLCVHFVTQPYHAFVRD